MAVFLFHPSFIVRRFGFTTRPWAIAALCSFDILCFAGFALERRRNLGSVNLEILELIEFLFLGVRETRIEEDCADFGACFAAGGRAFVRGAPAVASGAAIAATRKTEKAVHAIRIAFYTCKASSAGELRFSGHIAKPGSLKIEELEPLLTTHRVLGSGP